MSEKAALSKLGNDMQMVVTCLGARKPQKDASGSGTWTENGKRPNSILGRRTHATSLHHDQIQKCLIALHSIQTAQGFFFFGCTTQYMETLVPWSEIEPKPPALEDGSLNHWGSPTCYFSWSNTYQKHQPTNIQSARNAGLLLFPPSILDPVLFHFKSMQNSLVVTWVYLINKRALWNFNQVQTAPKEIDHWYSLQ